VVYILIFGILVEQRLKSHSANAHPVVLKQALVVITLIFLSVLLVVVKEIHIYGTAAVIHI
jgi:hypothetical protein